MWFPLFAAYIVIGNFVAIATMFALGTEGKLKDQTIFSVFIAFELVVALWPSLLIYRVFLQ